MSGRLAVNRGDNQKSQPTGLETSSLIMTFVSHPNNKSPVRICGQHRRIANDPEH